MVMKFYNPFKYKVYSYKQIHDKLKFYISILQNPKPESKFDCILAIESGGLHTAAIVNKYLRLPLHTIILKSYGKDNKQNEVTHIDNGFDFESLKGKNVLIVDDLIDSGASIQWTIDKLDALKIRHSLLVIFWTWEGYKRLKKPNTEICFISKENEKPNKWVVFPWEKI